MKRHMQLTLSKAVRKNISYAEAADEDVLRNKCFRGVWVMEKRGVLENIQKWLSWKNEIPLPS